MPAIHTTTAFFPIRTDAELEFAHQRLDELLAADDQATSDEGLQDEIEVLTALIFYYEQRTTDSRQWSLSGVDAVTLLQDALASRDLTVPAAAQLLVYPASWLRAVLTRRAPITLSLGQAMHRVLGIAADAILPQIVAGGEENIQAKSPLRAA